MASLNIPENKDYIANLLAHMQQFAELTDIEVQACTTASAPRHDHQHIDLFEESGRAKGQVEGKIEGQNCWP